MTQWDKRVSACIVVLLSNIPKSEKQDGKHAGRKCMNSSQSVMIIIFCANCDKLWWCLMSENHAVIASCPSSLVISLSSFLSKWVCQLWAPNKPLFVSSFPQPANCFEEINKPRESGKIYKAQVTHSHYHHKGQWIHDGNKNVANLLKRQRAANWNLSQHQKVCGTGKHRFRAGNTINKNTHKSNLVVDFVFCQSKCWIITVELSCLNVWICS